jgi:hypothetical protein
VIGEAEGLPRYPDVQVRLTGTDGNAFAVIGLVRTAIRSAHGTEAADEFSHAAMQSGSYDELLRFVMRTVDVA